MKCRGSVCTFESPFGATGTVSRVRYGDVGQTMREAARLVRLYRSHPAVRAAALEAVDAYAALPPTHHGHGDLEADPGAVARALFAYVAARVRYVPDPFRTELVQSPDLTLALGAGDCDDLTVLLEAMAQSLGLRTRAVVVGYEPGGFDHVWPEVDVSGSGAWLPLDVTMPAPGMTPPAVIARVYDADDGLLTTFSEADMNDPRALGASPEEIEAWMNVVRSGLETLGLLPADPQGGLPRGHVLVRDPRTGQFYTMPEAQAQQLAAQGLLYANGDGSYTLAAQPGGIGQQAGFGGLGTIGAILVGGLAIGLVVNHLRR